jgi:hypothetical protein
VGSLPLVGMTGCFCLEWCFFGVGFLVLERCALLDLLGTVCRKKVGRGNVESVVVASLPLVGMTEISFGFQGSGDG